jgi:chemotaxis protein methyltransferase CheR
MTEKSKNELVLIDDEIDHLLIKIHQQFGYDFSDYSRASIKRRITRFLLNNKISGIDELTPALMGHADFFEYFIEELMVNVTEMFRDPSFYKALAEKVLPVLSTYPFIRIWDAGCSTGEELISLAIMLHENKLLKRTRIYATDINQKSLLIAREGIIPLSEIPGYSKNYLHAGGKNELSYYYSEEKKNVVFRRELLENIVFYPHNLASDASFNEFHLIVCRNVFIYFNKQLQERVLKLFIDSLIPLGFLGLGKKETISLSAHVSNFNIIDSEEKIYRKIMI